MLWHLKNSDLSNAVSQSSRPPVSKAKTHTKAETGKQSENSASPNSRVLAQGSCTRDGFFDAKTKLCATKNRHNYLKFCAFAKKNAVSLTNQGCKGCQNEALRTAESSVHSKKLCAQRKALCTGKSSVHGRKLCAQRKALCTTESSVHNGKLCAQRKALCLCTALEKALCLCTALEKALCTGKGSVPVHGTGKSSVHATIPEKGARTSQKQRKTSNRPIPSGSGPVNCFVIYCISSLSHSRYGPQTLKRPRQNNLFLPEYPY